MQIKHVLVSPGLTGFYFDDQQAIKRGNYRDDGFTIKGDPITSGFTSIRQKGESISVQIILEDGQVAYGDCAAVQYSGCGGRDPLFLAEEFIPVIQEHLVPLLVGQDLISFRQLAGLVDCFTNYNGKLLHTAIRYGVTQALLDAVAKANNLTMAEVIAKEYGTTPALTRIPVFTQSGDDRYTNADRMIIKEADVIPHGLFNNLTRKLGDSGEKLIEYILWLKNRVNQLGPENYLPIFHIDVYGTIGEAFDQDLDQMVEYFAMLEKASYPHQLRIEGPIDLGGRQAQIDGLSRLTRALDEKGISVEIVADEWCNTLEDIKAFTDNKAGHVVQIKTPDLGGINNTIEAVLYCKEKGMGAYLGGTCNETDRSAQVCTHIAVATKPCQLLAKPGMGVDEGLTVVNNEMNRLLALLNWKQRGGTL